MSIRVNMQLSGNEPIEVNAGNFPRLFTGDRQTREISIVYTEDGIDVQSSITNGNLFQEAVERWIITEEIRMNNELAEIQKKLEILKSLK